MVKRKTKKIAYRGDYKAGGGCKGSSLKERNEEMFGLHIKKDKLTRAERAVEFLTKDQKKDLLRNVKFYTHLSTDNLKELLAKNRQIKTGTRKELLDRCAEGRMMGGLKFCPKCKGGNLNFNQSTGEYFCRGFPDADDPKDMKKFKDCIYKSAFAERNKWVEWEG